MNINFSILAENPNILEAYENGELPPSLIAEIDTWLKSKALIQKLMPELSTSYYSIPIESIPQGDDMVQKKQTLMARFRELQEVKRMEFWEAQADSTITKNNAQQEPGHIEEDPPLLPMQVTNRHFTVPNVKKKARRFRRTSLNQAETKGPALPKLSNLEATHLFDAQNLDSQGKDYMVKRRGERWLRGLNAVNIADNLAAQVQTTHSGNFIECTSYLAEYAKPDDDGSAMEKKSLENYAREKNIKVEELRKFDVLHLTADKAGIYQDNTLAIKGSVVANFASCNFLGIEKDKRVKCAMHQAVEAYGANFYMSRSYVSVGYYEELEHLLNAMFNANCLVLPSTTQAHSSCLNLLVESKDAILIDQNAHLSIYAALNQIDKQSVLIERVKHKNMEHLAAKIKVLEKQCNRIWFLTDGVFSMYGDTAKFDELNQLMSDCSQLHLYIDDSNGMSWSGKYGTGTAFGFFSKNRRTIVVSSLGKGFGSSGAVAVFPDIETRNMVRNFGNALLYAGPIPPTTLAAGVASARIHLSPEIECLQNTLAQKIRYFARCANDLSLPFLKNDSSPIFFLFLGRADIGFWLCQSLLQSGFMTSLAVYPSVPENMSGIRITVNIFHTSEDIAELLNCIHRCLKHISTKFSYDHRLTRGEFELASCA